MASALACSPLEWNNRVCKRAYGYFCPARLKPPGNMDFKGMTTLPQDVEADLRRRILELEQRLDSTIALRDEAVERQTAAALVNFRLHNELRASGDRHDASAEILRTIANTSGDAAHALQRITDTAARFFNASSVTIRITDGTQWTRTIAVGDSSERILAAIPNDQLPIGGKNMPAMVYRENRQIHIPDLDNVDPAFADFPGIPPARAGGTRTISGTPLRRGDGAIGALIIHRDRLAPFTAEELALQQSFADQAVIAIENARLFNETKEALERQTATSDILKVIASSPSDVQPVFEAIATSANRLIGAFSTAVHRVIDDVVHLAAFTPTNPESDAALKAAFPKHRSEVPAAGLVENGEPAQIADAESADPHTRRLGRARGWRSVTFTPLMSQGEFIGFIACTRLETGVLANHHVQLLRTFADQAVIAIENARLFNETQEALERQTATADILKVIASSPSDVQPVFQAIAERSNRLLGGLSTAVYSLVDDVQHLMAFTPTSPEADAALKSAFPRPLSEVLWGEGIFRGEIFRIADAEAELDGLPAMREVARLRGWRSALLVPLLRDDKSIGLISVTRAEPGPFADHHVQLLKTFADQAVIAIENTRLFNETKEALERQTATADILKVIASSPSDVQPVFDAIVGSAKRLMGGFSSTVFRFIDGIAYLKAFTPTTAKADEILQSTFPRPVADYQPFQTTQAGDVTQVPDTEAPNYELKDIARARGYRSMVFAPLMNKGESIGMIAVTRVQPGNFTDHHVQLLQTFADQAVIAIENARLFDEVQARTRELQESLERQTATAAILSAINNSAGNLAPVFDCILENAHHLCGAPCGSLQLYQDDRVVPVAIRGMPPAFTEYLGRGYPITAAIREGVMADSPVQRADLAELARQHPDEPSFRAAVELGGIRTMVTVPLLKDGVAFGRIVAGRQEVRLFEDKQIALLQGFAAQAVIAIENARLLNELRESLQQQTATADVLKVIASSPSDLQPVFDAIAERSNQLVGGHSTTVIRFVGDMVELAAFTPVSQEADAALQALFPRPIAEGDPQLARVRRGEITEVTDTEAEGTYELTQNVARTRGWRSRLMVPLRSDNEAIGVISITRKEPGEFAAQHVELLRTFADQAVIAIQNVKLFDEVQARTRDLEESLQQQTATADVLKVISRSTFDLKTVLQTLVESAARLCDADTSQITRQQDGVFFRAETYGFSEEFIKYTTTIPVAADRGSAIGRALLEGKAANIPDVLADPEYTFMEARRFTDYRTVLAVPMLRESAPIGVIVMTRKEPRPFTDKQIELATTFADQAAIAIGNVQLFDEVQARTRELAQSLEDLRAAQDRLIQTEKLASLGQLTAGIAHEIKNPLNFVNNFSALSVELTDELSAALKQTMLADRIRTEVDELTGTLKDNLAKVVQHGKRADSIVKNMLLHSREGSGEHRPADVNALVDESLNLAYHGARAEKPHFNVTLERDFDPAAGSADVFPQEITRVLLNLISNGFYAVTKRKAENGVADFEPTVRATTLSRGDRVEIRIRDNGTGIPEHVRDKMFNPFFTTKPAGEGTGLGLSMSHDIVVKQHGGSIEVETEPGAFTEFRIVLPRLSIVSGKAGGTG